MKIKTDLIKGYIKDYINNKIEDFEIDENRVADGVAIKMLGEIQQILKNSDYSDFEVVEKIVNVFEFYDIDFGDRHDF